TSARTSPWPRSACPDSRARLRWSERSRWRSEMPARAAAAAASALTTSRGTATTWPSSPISIACVIWFYGPEVAASKLLTRAEGVDLPPADHIELLPVGHHGGERTVRERPHLLARFRVESVGAALERGEVDDAVDHGRGPRNRPIRVELPQQSSRCRVEGVEGAVVRADKNTALPDGRRAVDEPARALRPAH